MKIDVVDRVVAPSQNFDSVQCTIDPEDMRHISSLLRNNYSDTILAVIREIYSNAVDATKENGGDVSKITVTLPNAFNSSFEVRDYGKGLSKDDIFGLYSKIGRSTKRDNNNSIGSFGIGRLSPLAYNKDGFTITSYYNGKKSVYFMYISEEDDMKIDEIFVGDTTEVNGLQISVPVNSGDFYNFANKTIKFFRSFPKSERPIFCGAEISIAEESAALSGNDWRIYDNRALPSEIIMGGVSYPLNMSLVGLDDDDAWMANCSGLSITVPIGAVKLHHSRESIEFNRTTKSYLQGTLKRIGAEIKDEIGSYFKNIDCLVKAKVKVGELRNILPYTIFNTFNSKRLFQYKGVSLGEYSHFEKCYFVENGVQVRIPYECRMYTKDSSDRIRNSRAYTVACSENAAYVINDFADGGDKIMNRIATLLDTYPTVYYFVHDSSVAGRYGIKGNGAEIFARENRFDLVNPSIIYKLSQVTPRKISRPQNSNTVTRNASYYFKIDNTRIRPADAADITNVSLIKPYMPFKDRRPTGKYIGFKGDNYDNDRIASSICTHYQNAFNSHIYGVSVVVSESKAFAKANDFVDFVQHVKNLWDNTSDDIKNIVYDYLKYQTVLGNNVTKFHKSLIEEGCLPKLSKIYNDVKAYQIVYNANKYIVDFWTYVFTCKDVFGIEPPKVDDVSDLFQKTVQEYELQYPVLKTFAQLGDRDSAFYDYSYSTFIEHVCEYIKLADAAAKTP